MASPSSSAAKRRRVAPELAPRSALRALLPQDLARVDLADVVVEETPSSTAAQVVDGWGVDPNASFWTCIDDAFAGDPMPGLIKIKEYLEKWDREARTRVSLGSSYLFDLARDQFTRPGALESPVVESAEAAKKRDLLLRYVVAARGRLLDHASSSSSATPGGDLVAAMRLLLNEAEVQHAKNVSLYETLCERVVASATSSPSSSSASSALASCTPATHSISEGEEDLKWVTQLVKQCSRVLDRPDNPNFCHHCNISIGASEGHHLGSAAHCARCRIAYCRSCLRKIYDQTLAQMAAKDWVCPRCTGTCWCTQCVKLGRVVMLKRGFGIKSDSATLSATEHAWYDAEDQG